MLESIRIVLVETSHPGNIGASARAMMTMGLAQLYLVQPKHFPSEVATARASGATGILKNAVVCHSLKEALTDCQWAIGASARKRSITWPIADARTVAHNIVQRYDQEQVAVVFGPERNGLSNEHIDQLQQLVTIPTNPHYGSLNLAAAVQIIGYELRLAALAQTHSDTQRLDRQSGRKHASHQAIAGFYQHCYQVLTKIGFIDPDNPKQVMRRLRRLIYRAKPDEQEVNILRGILTQIQKRQ